jgi:hypothetical protein
MQQASSTVRSPPFSGTGIMGRSRVCTGHKNCKVGAPHRSSAACSTPTNRDVPNLIANNASMSQPGIQITMTMQADPTSYARGQVRQPPVQ